MSLFRRLFGKQPRDGMRRFESPHGKRAGSPPEPLIVFGHMADAIARRTANDTTLGCVAVASLPALESLLASERVVGIRAQSRTIAPGEAQEAIQVFRARGPRPGLAIYGAWDYNVERAARRAIDCAADGIEMPGILAAELYAYVFGVLNEVLAGASPPTTVEQHVSRLRRFTTAASPFWSQQDLIASPYY